MSPDTSDSRNVQFADVGPRMSRRRTRCLRTRNSRIHGSSKKISRCIIESGIKHFGGLEIGVRGHPVSRRIVSHGPGQEMIMKIALSLLVCVPLWAQRPSNPALLIPQNAPPFDYAAVPDPLPIPAGFGAPAATAFDSKGHMFVLT